MLIHIPVGAVIRPGVPTVRLPCGLVKGLWAPFIKNMCGAVLTLSKVGASTPVGQYTDPVISKTSTAQ